MINELQTVLNNEIPLTHALGIKIESYSEGKIKISAPLDKNINHKNTAFGGSLYSIAVLTGWSLIYAFMKEQNLHGHIVIQESNIQYLKPVTGNIYASCNLISSGINKNIESDKKKISRFLSIYKRKNISRLSLTVIIKQDKNIAVIFKGQYVVHI